MSFQKRPHGQPYPVPRHRAKPDTAKSRRVPSGYPEGRQHEGREALARGKLVRCLDQSCTEALPGNGGIDRNVLDVQLPSIGLTRTKPTGWPSASATITSPSVSRFAAIGGVSAANESVPAEAYRVRAAFSITCNSGMSPDPGQLRRAGRFRDGWTAAAPKKQGFDPTLICGIGPRLEGWKEGDPHGVAVARHGVLVYERYFTGQDQRWPEDHWREPLADTTHDARTEHDFQSITKSIVRILVGIALDRHLIGNLEEPVLSLLPEYADLHSQIEIASPCATC